MGGGASPGAGAVGTAVEAVVAQHWARVVATVARTADGDLGLAEDAVQGALEVALRRWPSEGIPRTPEAWVLTVARRRVIDALRRSSSLATKVQVLRQQPGHLDPGDPAADGVDGDGTDGAEEWPDDRLRLVFTCCHPALAIEAQIALTLRLIAGLATPEIAHAFLVTEATMAKRLMRAKSKIRAAAVPYRVPVAEELPGRLAGVMRVIYLIFNEGYTATSSERLSRPELCAEAIRLAELLLDLLPEPEVQGFLALLLLTDSRRDTRSDDDGTLVVLEDQDRSRWDQEAVARGVALIEAAAAQHRVGPYQVQAAIGALHATAARASEVDWPQIVALYGELYRMMPTPIVALNRAAALGMATSPEAGLAAIDSLSESERLAQYHHLQAARADLLRRAGRLPEAADAYRRAMALCTNDGEGRYLQRRLREVEAGEGSPG
jgi:RNA polymerase sigma-70 factor, ECF subfamily